MRQRPRVYEKQERKNRLADDGNRARLCIARSLRAEPLDKAAAFNEQYNFNASSSLCVFFFFIKQQLTGTIDVSSTKVGGVIHKSQGALAVE